MRTLALAAGLLLATAAVWLLALGTGSTKAARGHGGRPHHPQHHQRVHVPSGFLGLLAGPTPFDPRDAAEIADTRIRRARIGLGWSQAQPHRGPFSWTASDVMIARLAENGIGVLPTLGSTPSWVAGKGTTPPIGDQASEDAWQTFVTAAVRRYRPGGTFWRPGPDGTSPFHARCGCDARPVPIRAWQIWNEPNLKHYFTPKPSPRRYAKLVNLSRSAIDAADSDAKLVLAGLSDGGNPDNPRPAQYLKRFYRIPGVKRNFDAVAIHPYARSIDNLRIAMTRFRRVMKERHDRQTRLWITEVGWGSGHPNRYGHNKGLRGQRRMVQRSMTLLAHKRKAWHVEHAYWFFWRDPPKSVGHLACSFCTSAGLLKHNRRPKPAYRTYRRLAKAAR